MEKIQKENRVMLRTVIELRREVRYLKELLAEKDEELSWRIQRRQRRVAYVESRSQEKLQKGPNDSPQIPEHGEHIRGQESETGSCPPTESETDSVSSGIDLSKKEETLKLLFLRKQQRMETSTRERLICMQEEFRKKLLVEREKNQREMAERQESLRQQLERGSIEERDDCLEKQLSMFLEHWQAEALQRKKQHAEMQQKLLEQETLLKQQEEEKKKESKHFQETFQQLWSYIEKKEEEEEEEEEEEKKKKKKGVWSRILKFWKK